jgi:hypothetical protein
MRHVERVVVSRQRGAPPNPALRRSEPTGAPKKARETLNVLLCPGSTASPRTRFYRESSLWGTQGSTRHVERVVVPRQHSESPNTVLPRIKPMWPAEPRRSFRQSRHPVRAQGIGGARSGRAKYKKHAVRVFYILGDGPPAKPGFLHSKKCAQNLAIHHLIINHLLLFWRGSVIMMCLSIGRKFKNWRI